MDEDKNIFEIIDTVCDKIADTIIFYDTEGIQHVILKTCLEGSIYVGILLGIFKGTSYLWSLV